MRSGQYHREKKGMWLTFLPDLIKVLLATMGFYLLIVIANSCIQINSPFNDDNVSAEGNIIDIITGTPVGNATVKILEWHQGILWGAPYYIEKDSCFADRSGHFALNVDGKAKFTYTLMVHGLKYFKDEGYSLTVNSPNKVNLSLFPHGYIKAHIVNKIDTAKYIEFFITPYYSSEEIFRDGFINTFMICPAFADTTIVTTTVGGVSNRLRIQVYPTDNVSDMKVVIDTSFMTRRHDTLKLDRIILR